MVSAELVNIFPLQTTIHFSKNGKKEIHTDNRAGCDWAPLVSYDQNLNIHVGMLPEIIVLGAGVFGIWDPDSLPTAIDGAKGHSLYF